MTSAAFIEPLPVVEYVGQLLGKDVLSRQLSDADRIKVLAWTNLVYFIFCAVIKLYNLQSYFKLSHRLRKPLEVLKLK